MHQWYTNEILATVPSVELLNTSITFVMILV